MRKAKTTKADVKQIVLDAIIDKKGNDLVCLDLRKIKDTPAEFFIIVHGDSAPHVRALYSNVIEELKKHKQEIYRSEGMQNSEWIIIDLADIVVHIFHRDKRDFYHLEDLWNDAKLTRHSEAPPVKRKKGSLQ